VKAAERECPGGTAAIRTLPVCPVRGLPIPVSSGRNPDGSGRFGENDTLAKLTCGATRRCGICGRELGEEVTFLGIESGARLTPPAFGDPGMHELCAEASLQLCPFIARARVPGRHGQRPKDGWLMWITSSYELVPGRGTSLISFLPGPAVRIRRFTYDGSGRLRETAQPARRSP
jgi:hypothetical protein